MYIKYFYACIKCASLYSKCIPKTYTCTCTFFDFRESIELFQDLSEIFSNENNQLSSRELLMKVMVNIGVISFKSSFCGWL